MERQPIPFETRLIHAMHNALLIDSPSKKRVERVEAKPNGTVEFDLFNFDTARVENWSFSPSPIQIEAYPVYDVTVKQPGGLTEAKRISDEQMQLSFFGDIASPA